jgi:hypothetical protein
MKGEIWMLGVLVPLVVAGGLAARQARWRSRARRRGETGLLAALARAEQARRELRRAAQAARRPAPPAPADATQDPAGKDLQPRFPGAGRSEEPEHRYFDATPRTATKTKSSRAK